jgi:amino acid adenylation domain-containing protein
MSDISTRIASLSPEKRALLAARLVRSQRQVPPQQPPCSEPNVAPLSYTQRGVWFLEQLYPGNVAYNSPIALRFTGRFNPDALEWSWNQIVQRHALLRTIFALQDGEPLQHVASFRPSKLRRMDFRSLAELERSDAAREEAIREARQPIDLVTGPPWRVKLLRCSEREHIFVVIMHHMVFDGWSLAVLVRELLAGYEAFLRSETSRLPEPPVQYSHFALAQRRQLDTPEFRRHLEVWRKHLEGFTEAVEIPSDRPRPLEPTFRGARISDQLQPQLVESLRRVAQSQSTTLFMVLLGAFKVLLSRYSGQSDVIVGSPMANRERSEYENLIGFFANTLALRTDLSGDPMFVELLARVKEATLLAYDFREIPFEKLVEELKPERKLNRNPFFGISFSLQNFPMPIVSVPDLSVELLRIDNGTSKFDLSIALMETQGGLATTLDYNVDLFDASTANRLLRSYTTVLEGVAREPRQKISQLPLLSKVERDQILINWNATRVQYPRDRRVHELFEAQARRTPQAVAVAFGEQELRYGELDDRSRELGHYLRRLGVGSGAKVAICLEPSTDMIVGLLGILKAGAAYVPIDPDYPEERISFMLADTEAMLVLTCKSLAWRFSNNGIRTVCLDTGGESIERFDDGGQLSSAAGEPGDLAYILFTSGSTGQPKGVCVPHQAIVRLVVNCGYLQLSAEDVVAQVSNCCFDAAVFEIWGALLNGCRLVGIEREDVLSAERFSRQLRRHEVTTLVLTTALFNELVHERPDICGPVRNVLIGGEECDPGTVRKVLQSVPPQRLLNMYGPTETTTFATWYEIKGPAESCPCRIPIGRPIANTEVYILDSHLNPVPIGVVGEICIGGEGVANGYLNRPELTAERFIDSPFGLGRKLYRSGDLGRFLSDGNIEFLGRRDQQVKIRGFRIELGEIETALLTHPEVQQAVVCLRDADRAGKGEDRHLVSYVVPADRGSAAGLQERLSAFLKRKLPGYMVPSAFVFLEKLPLTPNGKIDRQALPSAEPAAEAYRPPRTPEEEILCGIYADLLSLDSVGINDNFFSLGGHSLLAMRLVNRVRSAFGVELSVRVIFEAPSIAELVAHMSGAKQASAPLVIQEQRPERLPLSFAQERLWFLDKLEGFSTEYNMAQALRLRGHLDLAALQRAIAALVERHEILRTHFGEHEGEPYQIIEAHGQIALQVEELSELEQNPREDAIEAALQRQWEEPFDLGEGPLLRMRLLKLGAHDHILLWSCHHAIFDGWSAGIFGSELSILYNCFREGRSAKLPELPAQYVDYALWQRRRMERGEHERLIAYWSEQLSDLPLLELRTDCPRGPSPDFAGGIRSLLLSRSLCQQLQTLAGGEGASMAMVLLAAFELLLARLSGQDDVAVGFPIAGRNSYESERLIGLFVNTLVLRAKLDGSLSFRQLLAQVRKTFLDGFAHQEMPFEKLVEELNPERVLNRHPLFEVLFNYINIPQASLDIPSLSVERLRQKAVQAKFPITLYLEETSEGVMLRVVYQTALFLSRRIDHILDQFQYLLRQIAEEPDLSIYTYSLVTSDARKVLPDPTSWLAEPEQIPVTRRFLSTATFCCDRIALRHETREWTYRELAGSSKHIAALLKVRGVQPGDAVAVTGPRSFGLIAGILGVLLARGVLLTLDLSLPVARRDLMLQTAKCKHCLSVRDPQDANEEATLPFQAVSVTRISVDGNLVDGCDSIPSEATISGEAQPNDAAYIFFTSGTSGIPKGILGSHKGLSHFLQWEESILAVDVNDRVAQLTGLSFDVVLRDIFLPLTAGATLCLPDTGLVPHAADVVAWMRRDRITILHTVPSLTAAWLDSLEPGAGLPDLRWVLMAGEPLTDTLVRRWREQMGNTHGIINLYGPTETTLAKCAYSVPDDPVSGVQPIGRPLPNTQALIINKADELCGIGEPGEIVIRTPFRTLGYLDVPQDHRTGFVANPSRDDPYDVVYRTGDAGSYTSEGLLSIAHRLDDQVKIRGNRVEPGEVVAVLDQYPGIDRCAVVTREDVTGEKCLVAYLVQKDGANASVNALRDFLKQKLPDYMLPAGFVVLDKLPLTPNGKLDRHRLPAPDSVPSPLAPRYVAPRDSTERSLAKLWSDLLKLAEVGIQDDFFALGGHSLIATRLVSQIRREFGVEVSLRAIFENPTIERLAVKIAEQRAASMASEDVDELLKDLESLPEEAAECELSKIEEESSDALPSAETDPSGFGS